MAGTQPSQNAEKANVVKLLQNQFLLEMLLQLIGLKRSTFFYHLADKVDKNAGIVQKVAEIYHQNNGNYGYRRITSALRRIWTINHKKVHAIMQTLGLQGKCKHRTYRSYQGEVGKIADNLLERNFQAIKPNEKWATDVTEFKCAEGKLYLSPIKDLFNGEIIAYDLAESPNFEQISRMMNQAVARLKGANRYYIPTKVGSIRWSLFGRFANETVLGKVCRKGKLLG